MSNIETKMFGGKITEVKQVDRNGVPVGLLSGYIATWDLDRGNDQFLKGAFLESIAEHKKKKRQIRFKDHHGRTVGGFPIEEVKEDDRGLFGIAEVNLDVQQGRELFSLAKQEVITDFSIGFSAVEFEFDKDIRKIPKAIVWEGSAVDEPMNENANIIEVKAVVPYQDLPLADRDRRWDSNAAKGRVRAWAGADEGLTSPSIINKYKKCFVWYDREIADTFAAYKLPISDIIDGRLTAVPRAIFAAAAAVQGARGGVDIPEAEIPGVKRHLNRYYAKMDLESPFSESSSFRLDDFSVLEEKELEKLLHSGIRFSQKNAKLIISGLKSVGYRDADSQKDHRDGEDWNEVLDIVKSIKS